MKRPIVTLIIAFCALLVNAQNELYIYQHSGVTDTLQLSGVTGISHERTDLNGRVCNDYVVMSVSMGQDGIRRYLLAALDSVVMQRDGRRIRLTRFVGYQGDRPRGSRVSHKTSMDGDFMVSEAEVDFFWTDDDHIYLADGRRDTLAAYNDENNKATADFYFGGERIVADEVPVYYLGQASPDPAGKKVSINKKQTQAEPNNSQHIGTSGDCGTGVATKPEGQDHYRFDLEHQAAYLCFLPYIGNDLGRTVLKKITVRSDRNIAGVYTLVQEKNDDVWATTLSPVSDLSQTVTLTTGGNDGFMLPKNAMQSTSAFMVIAPQAATTRLTCEFTVYDTELQSEGVFTKIVDLDEVEANKVYVIKANCNNYVVDLGLPMKFLNHNMGAFAPEEYGGYYAFGELNDKGTYSNNSYVHYNQYIGSDIRLSEYDVAHMRLGQNFSIPTHDEMCMLVDSCTSNWTTVNGHAGRLVTGKNGNHLFIPAAGYRSGSDQYVLNTNGHYRTSNLTEMDKSRNWRFHVSSSAFEVTESEQTLYRGLSIRPVVSSGLQTADGSYVQVMTDSVQWQVNATTAKLYGTQYGKESSLPTSTATFGFIIGSKDEVMAGGGSKLPATLSPDGRTFSVTTPVEDMHLYYYRAYVETADSTIYGNALYFGLEYVDLGLPSGTKWANMNVGAVNDLHVGDYFAFGETEPKSTYSLATHQSYQESTYLFHEGLRDIQATRYDAASVHWNGPWMIPTDAEVKELKDNCTVVSGYYHGVKGYLFTSKVAGYTDKSIFVPYMGYKSSSAVPDDYLTQCYIPSSTPLESQNDKVYQFYNNKLNDHWSRYYGKTFRPVFKTNATSANGKPLYIRTLMALKDYDGTTDKNTLRAVIRGLSAADDATTYGFAYWLEGNESDKTYVPVTPDADGYIFYELSGLEPGTTYCYAGYVDNGEKQLGSTAYFTNVELVDLGLSVLWANVNVGACNEGRGGDFYRWGGKTPYRKTAQQYADNQNISPESGRDMATNAWGEKYRLATKTEWEELRDGCTWAKATRNGFSGFLATSKTNGKSIFLAAPGYYDENSSNHINLNQYGYYWASTVYSASNCYRLHFGVNDATPAVDQNSKAQGFSVRAVSPKNDYIQTIGLGRYTKGTAEVDTLICYYTHVLDRPVTVGFLLGDNDGIEVGGAGVTSYVIASPVNGFNRYVLPTLEKGRVYYYRAFIQDGGTYTYGDVKKFVLLDYVDLGLSSHNLWANINVGADYEEDFGDYYAWGETEPKATYSTGTYKWNSIEIGSDISGTEYDAATANLGLIWCLPQQKECRELVDGTDRELIQQNGINYWKFMNKSDHSKYIILPSAGRMDGSSLSDVGSGLYMPSTRVNNSNCNDFYLPTSGPQAGDGNSNSKYKGYSVRGIIRGGGDLMTPDNTVVHVTTDGCDWTIGESTATLSGTVATSATVDGATFGFIVGGIKDVDTTTPATASEVVVAAKDRNNNFTATVNYDGSAKFFRTFMKAGGVYYLGAIKSITAADLLDVEFDGNNQAFNGTFTKLPVVKHEKYEGSLLCPYNETYHRYEADFKANNYAGGSTYTKDFFAFDYTNTVDFTDFTNRLEDGHSLEVLLQLPEPPTTNSEAAAFASYESGGSGIGCQYKCIQTVFRISGSYQYVRSTVAPQAKLYYHVVGVWNKEEGKVYLYINGDSAVEPVAVSGNFGLPSTSSRYYIVGGEPTGSSADEGWNGRVVFARLYDKPLTADEVQQLYQGITR